MKGLTNEELRKMDVPTRKAKLKELKLELVRAQVRSAKTSIKTKEIKKAIARLLTVANATKTVQRRQQ